MNKVGIVTQINLFPVKSMRGISVQEAFCHWFGLNGDRKWGFVKEGHRGGFPWVTGRDIPEMILFETEIENHLENSAVRVKNLTGQWRSVESPDLLQELSTLYGGKPLACLNLKRGTFDELPLSIISTNALQAMSRDFGEALNPDRFRINIIVETDSDKDLPETDWLGHRIQFGHREDSASVMIDRRIPRCQMITLDPHTADKKPAVLKTVAQKYDACAGVHATAYQVGAIQVGDEIMIG